MLNLFKSKFRWNSPAPGVFAGMTFAAGALLSVGLHRAFVRLETRLADQRVLVESIEFRDRLEGQLEKRVRVLRRAADEWTRADGPSPDDWARVARGIQTETPDVRGVDWVDARGIIRRAEPVDRRAQFVGLDLDADEVRGAAIADARRTGRVASTPFIDLRNGEIGFEVTVPLPRTARRAAGSLVAIFALDPLLAAIDHRGYELRVRDTRSTRSFATTSATASEVHRAREIQFASSVYPWKIQVIPDAVGSAGDDHPRSRPALILGLLLSALAGGLAFWFGALARAHREWRRQLAHELNTPLATIKGKVQHLELLARRDELSPATLAEGFVKIDQTVDRAARVVTELSSRARGS